MEGHFSILVAASSVYLTTFPVAHGQQTTSAATSQQVTAPSLQVNVSAQATLQSYQTEQRTVVQSLNGLIAGGATPTQLAAWQQQHGALLASQKNQAASITVQTAPTLLPTITDLTIPNEASLELADLIVAKANLLNEDILSNNNNQLQNTTSSSEGTPPALPPARLAELQAIAQKVQAVNTQSASATVPMPGPTVLPPNASSKLKAFLLARDQLMREEIQFFNQYAASPSSVRDAAVKQWHLTNATRFLQLQQLAQALAQNQN